METEDLNKKILLLLEKEEAPEKRFWTQLLPLMDQTEKEALLKTLGKNTGQEV